MKKHDTAKRDSAKRDSAKRDSAKRDSAKRDSAKREHAANAWEIGGCWPTPQQELLLRACLWRNEDGVRAWNAWKNQVDVERLDHGSSRLLPLLLANLKAQNVDDALLTRFKSVTRHTWYQNQMMFARASELLQQLHDANIQTMILKGAALISLQHYEHSSLRPMNDFDLMVPTHQAARAMELLRSRGWKPDTRGETTHAPELIDERYLNFVLAQPFINEREQSFDLHRHLLPQCCAPDADESFWESAITTELNGVATLALNPTDQVLHACIHGVHWNSVPPLRWIADVMMVMRTAEIDWNRLLEHADKRGLNLPLGDALRYLRDEMDAPIPIDVIQKIEAMPASRLDHIEYSMGLNSRESWSPWQTLWLRYRWFSRWQTDGERFSPVFGFAEYLRRLWKVRHLWELPFYAWAKTVRQARRWLRNGALR